MRCRICRAPAAGPYCFGCADREPTVSNLASALDPDFEEPEEITAAMVSTAVSVEEWVGAFGFAPVSLREWRARLYSGRGKAAALKQWGRLRRRLRADGYPHEVTPDSEEPNTKRVRLTESAARQASYIRRAGQDGPEKPGFVLGNTYRDAAGRLYVAVPGGLVGQGFRFRRARGRYYAVRVDVAGLCAAWGIAGDDAEQQAALDKHLSEVYFSPRRTAGGDCRE